MKIYVNNIFKSKKEKNNLVQKKYHLKKKVSKKTKVERNNIDKLKTYENIKEKDERNTINFKENTNKYIRKGAIIKYKNNEKVFKINDTKKNIQNINNISKKIKINKYNLPKSYYFLFVLMIGLAVASIKLTMNLHNNFAEEDYAVFNSQESSKSFNNDNSQAIFNQNIDSNNVDTRNEFEELESSINTGQNSNFNTVIDALQEKVENTVIKKEEPLVFIKPLDGEISKIFSDDKVIYSKTLDMWKTHDGIDISGNLGDIVYSCERGTIEKIYDDAFYGVTVVVNHGQGYKSSYSNLSSDVFVKIGQSVKKGQKIGNLGNTSIGEIKDLPHLHFMLYENEEIIDPSSIFK